MKKLKDSTRPNESNKPKLEGDLEVDEVMDDEEEVSVTYDIASYPSDLTLSVIYEMWKNGDIVIPEFQHKVLASFTNAYFARINGRIKVSAIREDYISKFGDKYLKRFDKKLEAREQEVLRLENASVRSSYANIITWRNGFAHEGIIPATATYEEVRKAYTCGKHVIHCLAESMKR